MCSLNYQEMTVAADRSSFSQLFMPTPRPRFYRKFSYHAIHFLLLEFNDSRKKRLEFILVFEFELNASRGIYVPTRKHLRFV